MYCKICGTNYNALALYCLHDGQALAETSADAITLHRDEAKFCSNCSQANQGVDNYCSHCGVPFYSVEEQSDYSIIGGGTSTSAELPVYNSSKLSIDEFIHAIRRGWLGSLISIVLLAIISSIISSGISTIVNRYINSELGMLGSWSRSLSVHIKLIGFDDVMLLTNLVSSKLKVDAGNLSSASASIHMGLVVLLLVPFISLFLGGFIATKRNQISNSRDSFTLSVGIGIVYALFLALVSLIGGTSQNLTVPLLKDGVLLSFSYSFFSALFQGLIIGFLFSFMGSLLAIGSYRITAHLRRATVYGESLHQAFSTLFWGVLVSFVYVAIVLLIKGAGDVPFWAWLLLLPQGAVYIWNIAQMNTLTLSSNQDQLSVTLFKGIHGLGVDVSESGINTYIYLSFFIVLVLLLMAGIRIGKANMPLLKSLFLFSGTYALLMAVLVAVTKLAVQGQGEIDILGTGELAVIYGRFGVISTFFICFLVSGIIAFVGTLLSQHISIGKTLNK